MQIKATLLCTLLLICTACTSDPYVPPEQAPPDFSLAFSVRPPADSVDTETMIFILEPSGTLRVARGAGCTLETYPDPTTLLTPRQVQAVYASLLRGGLLSEVERDCDLKTYPEEQEGRFEMIITLDSRRLHRVMPFYKPWTIRNSPIQYDPSLPQPTEVEARLEGDWHTALSLMIELRRHADLAEAALPGEGVTTEQPAHGP